MTHDRLTAGVIECTLRARSTLRTEYNKSHSLLVQFVGRDDVCRRVMAIPGVGPVASLTFSRYRVEGGGAKAIQDGELGKAESERS
ncbi:MAG: hypothetical protein M3178_14360 [Pseudomonadota bacterium]|nr:hypothetical protein [Pseudomonadota bacterium]